MNKIATMMIMMMMTIIIIIKNNNNNNNTNNNRHNNCTFMCLSNTYLLLEVGNDPLIFFRHFSVLGHQSLPRKNQSTFNQSID